MINIEKQSLILLCGCQGAGKTTIRHKILAENENVKPICLDDLREVLCGDASDQSKNKEVYSQGVYFLKRFLREGSSVVFDATNLTPKVRGFLLNIANELGVKKVAIVVKADLNTCIARNASRSRVVPESVLRDFYKRFVSPTNAEGFDQIIEVEND